MKNPAQIIRSKLKLQPSENLSWAHVVRYLQINEGLSLHVGGRYAMTTLGFDHYLRFSGREKVTLYGDSNLPAWLDGQALELNEDFDHKKSVFFHFDSKVDGEAAPIISFSYYPSQDMLLNQGLMWHAEENSQGGPFITFVCSTPERALLEYCCEATDAGMVYVANTAMQLLGVFDPQPKRVEMLLLHCLSVKGKRLFLALAQENEHPWLKDVDVERIDLGKGECLLVPYGVINKTYQIWLPEDLHEQESA